MPKREQMFTSANVYGKLYIIKDRRHAMTSREQAILEYMNEEKYPGEFIAVDELIVQGVARTVIKKAKPKLPGDYLFTA